MAYERAIMCTGSEKTLTRPLRYRIHRPFEPAVFHCRDWQVRPDVLLYVAHRKGYKPGGFNTQAQFIGTPNATYAPTIPFVLFAGFQLMFAVDRARAASGGASPG